MPARLDSFIPAHWQASAARPHMRARRVLKSRGRAETPSSPTERRRRHARERQSGAGDWRGPGHRPSLRRGTAAQGRKGKRGEAHGPPETRPPAAAPGSERPGCAPGALLAASRAVQAGALQRTSNAPAENLICKLPDLRSKRGGSCCLRIVGLSVYFIRQIKDLDSSPFVCR